MPVSRIFRIIWRVNAVLILMVALLVIGFVIWNLGPHFFQNREKEGVASTLTLKEDLNATWSLGAFEELHGLDYSVAPVYSKEELGSGAFSSKEGRAVRNYLFLNLNDKSSRWLLSNDQQRVILSREEVCVESPDARPLNCAKAQWQQFRTVPNDTNGDGRLSESDKTTLSFSDADGTHFSDVLTDVVEIKSVIQRTVDRRLVIYWNGGSTLVAEVDIPTRKVLTTKLLPVLGGR